ncbi:hypothetical protein B0J11DRAFT_611380 [Dendryphion nanum]|uniref:Uncharacterized protein n=1 Tax=Dendryphion nanum TaxID=256645 RepID=A0A9P9ECM8_9PLEO|nr:hypothetical protein B0J11DRAFT_611380 [Dendryphion nanum]
MSSVTVGILSLPLPTADIPVLTFYSNIPTLGGVKDPNLYFSNSFEQAWKPLVPNVPSEFIAPATFYNKDKANKPLATLLYNLDKIDVAWTIPIVPGKAEPTSGSIPVTLTGIATTATAQRPSGSTTTTGTSQEFSVTHGSEGVVTPPTSTNTTTIAKPTGPVSQSNGLSSGAAAGVAIGCLLAGALIAGALLWFFCIRSRKRSGTRDAEASSIALIRNEKGPSAKATSLGSGSPISRTLENGLPQPLEDGAISGEISKISNLIKNHVQSFYHHSRVSPGLLDIDDLQALGKSLPISTGTLSTLLGNSDTREVALRFSIAWVVISRIHTSGDANSTFLPPEVATCLQSIPVTEHKPQTHATFLNRWRVVTAELMQSSYGRSTFPVTDPRTRNIEKAADILDGVLRPYMDSRVDDGQRRRNLEEILKRAAIFAFTLFSQPSSWDFDWKDEEGVQSGSLCIFPALIQVTNELGEPVRPPREFSEAIVRRLDG